MDIWTVTKAVSSFTVVMLLIGIGFQVGGVMPVAEGFYALTILGFIGVGFIVAAWVIGAIVWCWMWLVETLPFPFKIIHYAIIVFTGIFALIFVIDYFNRNSDD